MYFLRTRRNDFISVLMPNYYLFLFFCMLFNIFTLKSQQRFNKIKSFNYEIKKEVICIASYLFFRTFLQLNSKKKDNEK